VTGAQGKAVSVRAHAKPAWRACAAGVLSLLFPACLHAQPSGSAPVGVVFDTDMYSDIDDALALAMLHTLEDRGEVHLLAVTVGTDDRWIAPFVDLVDAFYGHEDVPVGVVHGGIGRTELVRKAAASGLAIGFPAVNYTEALAEEKTPGGASVYPHRLVDASQAPDAVSLLRHTLAARPDGSVIVIEAGYSTNLARLLDSAPDAASPLDGRELVRRKVRLLSIMAGNFAAAPGDAQTRPVAEFNLLMDVPSAQEVFTQWPTPVVASGAEIGGAMLFPGVRLARDFSYAPHHPIGEACRDYLAGGVPNPAPIMAAAALPDHPTYDLTAVLYAARPEGGYFSLSEPGTITVMPDGSARFAPSPGGAHRHLILSEAEKAKALEAMVMLATEPPARRIVPAGTAP
jgi:inosine-uridine nucleoside N-ribohydrolase